MFKNKTFLAVITARGGSKGLPGKNVLPLNGKPLIAWTVEAALKSKYLDRVILSSDDPAIIDAAREAGCDVPFTRPAELAGDKAASVPVIEHALQAINAPFDFVVLLQPTSPLRIADDIDLCIETCLNTGAPAAVTVCESKKSPHWMYHLSDGRKMTPVVNAPAASRRQDLPPVVALNGAVYIADCAFLKEAGTFVTDETIASVMPVARSFDIDDMLDFICVEAVMQNETLLSAGRKK